MMQNIIGCLSNLSIIPKENITELVFPIIDDSSISNLGCPSFASYNFNGVSCQNL